MKYFIWFVVVLLAFSAGVFGAGYKLTSDFETLSGITWTRFVEGNEKCAAEWQEPCNMYGGFAPLSQFTK